MRRADNGVGKATAYAKADNGVAKATAPPSRHPRSTHRPQTSSSPKYPPHPNFVILRAVAESISPCQRTTQKTQRPLHTTMDTATSRSMTALVSRRRMRRADNGVGKATVPPSRHSRSTRRTQTSSSPKYPPHPNFVIPEVPPHAQTSSFCAQSQNPSPPANAPPRKPSALCTPPWILRLRAV